MKDFTILGPYIGAFNKETALILITPPSLLSCPLHDLAVCPMIPQAGDLSLVMVRVMVME